MKKIIMNRTMLSQLLFFLITVELFALALAYEITKYQHTSLLKYPLIVVGFQVILVAVYLFSNSDTNK